MAKYPYIVLSYFQIEIPESTQSTQNNAKMMCSIENLPNTDIVTSIFWVVHLLQVSIFWMLLQCVELYICQDESTWPVSDNFLLHLLYYNYAVGHLDVNSCLWRLAVSLLHPLVLLNSLEKNRKKWTGW